MPLEEAVARQDNDYDDILRTYEKRTNQRWIERARVNLPCTRSISVVIPARNAAYSIGFVLDALRASVTSATLEVIVVDDASSDTTASIARMHALHPKVVIFPTRYGPSVARNIGTAIAKGETVLYLDADMIVPPHVIHEHAVRATSALIAIGFRHNVQIGDSRIPEPGGVLKVEPDLEADHRVNWYARPGVLIYSGTILEKPVTARPLDDTYDFRALGKGKYYYDWDLPRMVVTAMVSMPRSAVMDVGGFDSAFADGWAVEDTHLGAKLIALGLKVVPLRMTVGFHIDPPDAGEQWKVKLATWPRNIALYRQRLTEPAPLYLTKQFLEEADRILHRSEVY